MKSIVFPVYRLLVLVLVIFQGAISLQAIIISAIVDRTIAEDANTGAIAFNLTSFVSRAPTLSGASSNPALVNSAGIVFGGTGGSRTVTVTPIANAFGVTKITITADDLGFGTDTEVFVLTVTAVNDPPTISATPDQTTNEDTALGPLNITVGDVETAATSLDVTAVSLNTTLIPNSSILLGGSGALRTLTLTPALNQSGTADILVTVSDRTVSVQDRFVVTVNAVNDPPSVGSIEDQTIKEDTSTGLIGLSISDPESPIGSLILTASSSDPVLFPSGSVVFFTTTALGLIATPAANQFGTAIITVTASDRAASSSRSFTIVVNNVNDPPTVTGLSSQTGNEDTPLGPIAFTINDLETPASSLVLSVTSANTSVIQNSGIVFGGSGTSRTLTLTPVLNASGSSLITVTVSDGSNSRSQEFNYTVNAVNDPPVITPIADQSLNEDSSLGPVSFSVTDVDSPVITVTPSSSNQTILPDNNISVTLAKTGATFTLTPALNQNGVVNVTFTARDGSASSTDTFVVTVKPVNDAPTISRTGDQTTNEDTALGPLTFTLTDLETPLGSLTLTGTSSDGVLFPPSSFVFGGSGGTRTLLLTPALNASGSANIVLTVGDGTTTASTAFNVTVNPVNDPPTISNIADQSINEDSNTGALAFTVNDIETAAASLTLSATSSDGALVPPANIVFGGSGSSRTVTVTPASGAFGVATITVTVSDGSASASDSFVLLVGSVNDLPTISNIPDLSVNEDTPTGVIPFTIGDAETPAKSLILSFISSSATLFPPGSVVFGGSGANRTLTATPASNQSGSATITVSVSDGIVSASDSFLITVNPVNDLPAISSISDQTIDEDASTPTLTFSISDAEAPAASLTVSVGSSSNTLFPPGSFTLGGSGSERTLKATPTSNQNGAAVLTVSVSDGTGSATRSFQITVNPVNDAPTISNIPDAQVQTGNNSGAIPFTISDVETPAEDLILSVDTSNPALIPVSAVVLGGSGVSRTVLVTPPGNSPGTAIVTVKVSDGQLTGSDTFTINVSVGVVAPKLVDGPASQNVLAGESITLFVNATGTAPLQYQWFFNNIEIPGAIEPAYLVRSAQAQQAGHYTVKVSNSAGSVSSPPATINVVSLDFGDAPDKEQGGAFPTLITSNGARHGLVPGFLLGTRADSEANGQPNSLATGDDLAGNGNDEDGVELLTSPLVPGQSAQIRVTLTDTSKEGGRLDAWVDFNGDQTWSEPGERIFSAQTLAVGANILTFQVPKEAKTGDAFARFRLSRKGGLATTGLAQDGEVEDHRFAVGTTTELKLDFGDAPTVLAATVGGGYPTLLSQNGARHAILAGFFLGKSVDPESDGQPANDAKGDDANPASIDDEDGVEFKTPIVAGQTAEILVIASKPGRLDAWLDFNRNKTWADQGEQIFNSAMLTAGANKLSFNVPPSARSGSSYARFRFSSTGKLRFLGPALDGEVEDYRVSLKSQGCDLSNKGDDFWVTFPGNYNPHPSPSSPVSLCIVGEPGTTGEVTFNHRINFKQPFTIPASMSVKITLPAGSDLGEDVDVVRKKGVHIVSSDPVAVYGYSHRKHTTDGFLALPLGVIGTEYMVSGYGNVHEGVSALNGTQFAIVATEDETRVIITPSTSLLGYPKGEPFELILNEGDTYQLRDPHDATTDLSGTLVSSDKPIALFSGHQCANVDSKTEMFCDYLVEQTAPLNAWAKSYVVTPLATRSGGDTVRILAAQDKTSVFLNGAPLAQLNRGQSKVIHPSAPARIASDKPVLVSQFANSSDADDVVDADPFMIHVPATQFFSKDHMICTAGAPFGSHYINIVAPTGLAIKLNGAPLVAAFAAIPGSGLSWARVAIPTGAHAMEATLDFGVIVYGWDLYDSYGYPGGLHFGDLTPPTVTCPDEVIVSVGTGVAITTGQVVCGAQVPDLRPKTEVKDNCPLPTVRVLNQTPSPGTFVGIGEHLIVMTATDAAGNTATCTTLLKVVDTGALTIKCPNDRMVTCNKGSGAQVFFDAFASTPCGTKVPVECNPPSGSVFPLGKTKVKCVLDENGKRQTCSFFVTVVCPQISINPINPLTGKQGFALQWEENMILESAPSLDGPWTPLPSARQPWVAVPETQQQFFRVRPRNDTR